MRAASPLATFLIVSGCQALDHDTVKVETSDFDAQSRIVLDKVKVAMEETGGSLANVVKTNVFIKDAAMLRRYRDVERAFFRAHAPAFVERPPASTVFVMTELPRREFLIEVEAFGVADAKAPGWATHYHAGAVSAGNLLFLSGCDGSAAGEVTFHRAANRGRARQGQSCDGARRQFDEQSRQDHADAARSR